MSNRGWYIKADSKLSQLQSVVLVRCGNGYEAVARFSNPKLDFVQRHRSREALLMVLERKILGGRW